MSLRITALKMGTGLRFDTSKSWLFFAVLTVLVVAGVGGWYAVRQKLVTGLDSSRVGRQIERGASAPASVQGHRGFTLRSKVEGAWRPKVPNVYRFSIVDDLGTTVKDFAVVHEKLMHVIVVRADLTNFQHVHPEFDEATGEFTLPALSFPEDGPYRVFADFAPRSAQLGADGQPLGVTLLEDVTVGELARYTPQPLVEGQKTTTFQGYNVRLTTAPTPIVAGGEVRLSFDISGGDRPVSDLEPYLGALGHAVVLREGDLEFLHTHALSDKADKQTGTIDFAVTLPTPGRYKVFAQFQYQGEVITADFTLTAGPGETAPAHGEQH